ncbi:MAG TPA: NlpC/P60 family protein [Acidimicrobiia bacterium]|jgi:cell wall-associated NlpC family hydrolase|nr:NlpC/P60 family protein [Acidimicrobiia bacterium]
MLRTEPAIRHNVAARKRPRGLGRLSVLLAVALLGGMIAPFANSAFATSPLDQKRAEASHLANEIDANNNRIDVLDEQYNASVLKVAQLNKQIATAKASLKTAQRHTDHLRDQVRSRAADLYMSSRSGTLFPQLDAKNAQQVASRTTYTAAAASHDSTLLSSLRTATAQFNSKQKSLTEARDKAATASHRLSSTRDAIQSANSKAQNLLTQVKGQIGTLVKQQQEAEAAAARAAARARLEHEAELQRERSSGGSSGHYEAPPTNLPPPSGRAATAVSVAEAQVGKPYRYAAAGPSEFDCSGLVMYAWAHAGVSMVHSSAGQYTEFPHVPISQLAPGDLVFFGSPIHHVGMYVGRGTMVEAPHTGAFVKYSSIYRDDYTGAARP